MHIILLLCTLVGIAFAVPTSSTLGSPVFALGEVSEKLEQYIAYQKVRNILRQRPSVRSNPLPSRLSKRNSVVKPNGPGYTMPFRLSDAKQVLVNITVGSPPQEVEMVLDTGSSFTWFPSNPNSSHFDPQNSTSWTDNNTMIGIGYLDSSFCWMREGKDSITVGDTNRRIPLGIGSGTGCGSFGHGILGMDKNSDFLQATTQDHDQPLLFSFSFKNHLTEEGENLFTMGGLGELEEEDIIWYSGAEKVEDKGTSMSGAFEIDMPYIAYNRERFKFNRGHKVGVDTGSSFSVLPAPTLERFWKAVEPKPGMETYIGTQP
jgi:Eukaryotic aspartyl protease